MKSQGLDREASAALTAAGRPPRDARSRVSLRPIEGQHGEADFPDTGATGLDSYSAYVLPPSAPMRASARERMTGTKV